MASDGDENDRPAPLAYRGPVVGQGKQRDDLNARLLEGGHPGQHLRAGTSFEEVGYENEDGLAGPGDEVLAVGDCLVDVGAAAKLGAEQHIDGVG